MEAPPGHCFFRETAVGMGEPPVRVRNREYKNGGMLWLRIRGGCAAGGQLSINIGIFPDRLSIFVFPEINVLPQMRFPGKAKRLEKPPGMDVFRVTFCKNTMGSG